MSHQYHASEPIDLYDFDQTIYAGDSAIDFYLYALGKNPRLLIYMPYQALHFILYLLKIEGKTIFKSNFFIFVRGIDDVLGCVNHFWDAYSGKIKQWYRDGDHSRDVIISASPVFLLQPICTKLGTRLLIATIMDPRTGAITGRNCHGNEKVRRLHEKYPNAIVDEAYSDHTSDMPMLRLAKAPHFVIGERIMSLSDYQSASLLQRFIMRLRLA